MDVRGRVPGSGDSTDITLEEVKAYFGMPLRQAAQQLGICGTTLKSVCRRLGIQKWPFRTLSKLQQNAKQLRGALADVGAVLVGGNVLGEGIVSIPASSPALKLTERGARAVDARRMQGRQRAAATKAPAGGCAKQKRRRGDTSSDEDTRDEREESQ